MKKKIALFLSFLIMLSGLSVNLSAEKSGGESNTLLTGEAILTIEGTAEEPSFDYKSADDLIKEMKLVCENENYSLYLHTQNLSIAVLDKKSGVFHCSNPYNAKSDPYYNGAIAERLDSQLVINYVDPENVPQVIFSSTECAALGQYSVKTFENGARVDYSIGEEIPQPLYPKVISEEYYKEIMSKLSESDAYIIENYYTRNDISEISDENRVKELIASYPLLKSEVLYIVPAELSQREQSVLTDTFAKLGYTREQYKADSEKYSFEEDLNFHPNFKLSLEYILTDEGLKVNIPYGSISYDSNNFKLLGIDVLPYFVSDKPGNGNGYIFIPDGSGSIIDINQTGANRTPVITGTVYGEDQSNIPDDFISDTKQYYLPVYGVVKNDGSGIFTIIESGSEVSAITTRLGAPNSRYFCAYNSFTYASNMAVTIDQKTASMGSARTVYLFDTNLFNTDFTLSYYFLSGNSANYSAMAALYRDKLTESGAEDNPDKSDTKFVLNTVGTALYDNTFLGFKYKSQAEFTTYAQNLEILDYLSENGIKDAVLLLSGWQKNGLDASLNKKIKTSSALGGKKELKKLLSECQNRSVPVYLEQDVVYTANNTLFDSFNKKRDTAKRLDLTYSGIPSLDLNTRKIDTSNFTITPSKYAKLLKGFFKSSKSYRVNSVDLAGFGTYLNSDFNSKKNTTNRVQAKNYITDILKEYSEEYSLSVKGANSYVLPYVSYVREIPMRNSALIGETASVPFLQLVLSGKVFYSGEPVNLSEEPMREVLGCIETATSPAFILAYDNIELLKLTDFNYLYACGFENLKKRAVEYYNYIYDALKGTDGSRLVKHEMLSSDVSLSYFENGSVICVNKSSTDYKYNGKTVPALGYLNLK